MRIPKPSPQLKPTNVNTGGVHPLVKASMLPRMAAVKGIGIPQRAQVMASLPGVKRSLMSKAEMGSVRGEVGRRPRA